MYSPVNYHTLGTSYPRTRLRQPYPRRWKPKLYPALVPSAPPPPTAAPCPYRPGRQDEANEERGRPDESGSYRLQIEEADERRGRADEAGSSRTRPDDTWSGARERPDQCR